MGTEVIIEEYNRTAQYNRGYVHMDIQGLRLEPEVGIGVALGSTIGLSSWKGLGEIIKFLTRS